MIDSTVAVFSILAAIVLLSIWLTNEYKPLKKIGAALIGILLGMLASNIGILPGKSEAYDFLANSGVSAAVVLILLSVDIRTIKKAGKPMLLAFCIGGVGSAVGSILMALILSSSIGEETWKLSGQYTATYTGGGMNFAAMGQAFNTSSDLWTAAQAADVSVTVFWFLTLLTVPVIFSSKSKRVNKQFSPTTDADQKKTFTLEQALYTSDKPVTIFHIAALLCITFGVIWLSEQIETWFPVIPKILWLTSIVLVLTQIPFVKKLSGNAMLGNYLLLLFLASNGAKSVFANIIDMGPAVLYFALGVITVHGLTIFGVGRLFRIDMGTLAIASQANVGGSSSAMALASARGYGERILPGIAVGLLGYAIGNYLGLVVGSMMKFILL
jgi:uncharacterized membrane protein